MAADRSDPPVALVTGSTSGIGAAIARRLAADGYAVVLHSRQSRAAGQALVDELTALARGALAPSGHRPAGNEAALATYLAADLAVEAERVRLIEQAVAFRGRLDVLVNNAGISRVIAHADLAAATPEVWRELHEVNVIAPFQLVALAEPALRAAATRGRAAAVVNVSSHAGLRPRGASIPYAASKAALNHVTRLLALSLAPAIRVNAVAPGLVDTPLTADWTEAQQTWATRAPLRRAAQPDDIAGLVAMLVASDYLTGEVLLADGGLSLT